MSSFSKQLFEAATKTSAEVDTDVIPPEIDSGRILLQNYSHIAPSEIDKHLFEIRAKAIRVFPYGCVSRFGFMNLHSATDDPRFQAVTARLKMPNAEETFLEVGCLMGTLLRHLSHEGVSSDRLYGTDIQPSFLELGYDLFGDRDTTKATYLATDMLKNGDDCLNQLEGKIDVIYAANFFHLFEQHDQFKAATRIIKLLNRKNPNAFIFGINYGPKDTENIWKKYILDQETWREMWQDVSASVGIVCKVTMEIEGNESWNHTPFAINIIH